MKNWNKEVVTALKSNADIVKGLARGEAGIYHDTAPDVGEYPFISYYTISVTPSLHADNALAAYQQVYRVTIASDKRQGEQELANAVYDALTGAGFMWQQTVETNDGKEYYITLDFIISKEM